MKFFCINTAGASTEIVVYDGDKVFNWFDIDGRRASIVLLPQLDRLLDEARLTLDELDFFSCVIGPGSFTGIRIGVTTTRALSYSKNKPIIAVNFNEALAYNTMADNAENIISVLDGSNGTAYIAAYDASRREMVAPFCLSHQQAQEFIDKFATPKVVCVDEKMSSVIKGDVILPSVSGDTLARAVMAKAERGETVQYNNLIPLYIRVSQAERELAEKNNGI